MFDTNGNYLSQFGTSGAANGQFSSPSGLALDSGGNSYVVDAGNDRVQKFDPNGNFLLVIGTGAGAGAGTFRLPPAWPLTPT